MTLTYLVGLARRGHEVFWFANHFDGACATEVLDGVNLVRGGGLGTSVLRAWQWYRHQPPFDLVIDQHHGIPWYAPWWCHTRCVAYIHEVLGPIWNSFYPWPLASIGRWQERATHWAYQRVPFWTACESTREDLRASGVRHVTLLRYGVNTVALPQLEPKPLQEPLQLIVVSRLAPNKRIDHALKALQILVAQGTKAHLTVVGSGEMEAPLKSLAQNLNLTACVTFAGALPEAEKDGRLRQSHFLLHTSQREGWGLNVIEANAMGTPAVVYPVKGLIESTLHHQTGLVAAAETPAALALEIATCLAAPDDYPRYRLQAWERAKSFHWDRVLPTACDWLEQQARTTPS